MSVRTAQLSLFLVALLIGVLLVGQLRSQARPADIRQLSAGELSALIEQLIDRGSELQRGLAVQREQLREYRVAESQGASALSVTQEELRRVAAFGGLAGVDGQGIILDVTGSLDAIAVNDLINELRNAGAEAIAVNDIRITARSVAIQSAGSLSIDGNPIGPSFTIRAVGSPQGLFSAIERPGGIRTQLELFIAATIEMRESTNLRLPPTRVDLAPTVAQPVE
jgi:uncharacterized protein YlxW (UPF0749 family)